MADSREIRMRRVAVGPKVTQARVAQLAGLSEETVRKAESGAKVSARTLGAIERALEILEAGGVGADDDAVQGVLLDLPEEAYADLAPAEAAEAKAAAERAYLETARKIRRGE